MSRLKVLAAFFVLFFTAFALLAGVLVERSYRAAVNNAETEALAAAHVVATHMQWIVEASRQALRRVHESLAASDTLFPRDTLGDLNRAVAGLPRGVQVAVYDLSGLLRLSTDPSLGTVNVSDRRYFQEIANGSGSIVSELLVERASGAEVFAIGRPLMIRGELVGAGVIYIPASALADIWSSLGFHPGSTISVVSEDARIVARYPLPPGPVDLTGHRLYDELADVQEGTYTAVSPADGARRIVGFRRIENADLIAIAGVAFDDAVSSFWRTLKVGMLFGGPLTLVLVGSAWLIWRLQGRVERDNRDLTAALEQNRVLFREIHHRVKNNLQAVSSLIRLQPIAPGVKDEIQRRINAMSAVHEHIYRSDQFTKVEIASFIRTFVSSVAASYSRRSVEVVCDLEPVEVDKDVALPLAQILNEAVSNALKHGFPAGRPGRLEVELRVIEDGDRARLTVRDDGAGLAASEEAAGGGETTGMGMRLVNAFAAQLSGTATIETDPETGGVLFTLIFSPSPNGTE